MIVLDTPGDPAFSNAMRDILRRHNFGKPINPPQQSGNTAENTNGKEGSNEEAQEKIGKPLSIPPRDNPSR